MIQKNINWLNGHWGNMRQLSHDPFARESTYKRNVTTTQACSWCGSRKAKHTLYQYGVCADGSSTKTNWHPKLFCSKDCFNTYLGK